MERNPADRPPSFFSFLLASTESRQIALFSPPPLFFLAICVTRSRPLSREIVPFPFLRKLDKGARSSPVFDRQGRSFLLPFPLCEDSFFLPPPSSRARRCPPNFPSLFHRIPLDALFSRHRELLESHPSLFPRGGIFFLVLHFARMTTLFFFPSLAQKK